MRRNLGRRILRLLQRIACSEGEDGNDVDALCKLTRSILTEQLSQPKVSKKKKKTSKKKSSKKKTTRRR